MVNVDAPGADRPVGCLKVETADLTVGPKVAEASYPRRSAALVAVHGHSTYGPFVELADHLVWVDLW